jgi:hypothetical protein
MADACLVSRALSPPPIRLRLKAGFAGRAGEEDVCAANHAVNRSAKTARIVLGRARLWTTVNKATGVRCFRGAG